MGRRHRGERGWMFIVKQQGNTEKQVSETDDLEVAER